MMDIIYQQNKSDKIRIADWLVSNTVLTIKAISIITGLDEYTVRKIFNAELNIRYSPINPIEKEFIKKEDIKFWEQCPDNIADKLLHLGIKTHNSNDIELLKNVPDIINNQTDVHLKPCEIDDLRTREIYFTRAIKIFWASHGHNAWYGTWCNRFYVHDCFLSYQAAKKAIEHQRSQGRTFTINELVSLCLYTDKGIILISGINSEFSHPFKNIDTFNTIEEFIGQIKKIQLFSQYTPYLIAQGSNNLFFEEVMQDNLFATYNSSFINGILYMKKSESRKFDLFPIQKIQKSIHTITHKAAETKIENTSYDVLNEKIRLLKEKYS